MTEPMDRTAAVIGLGKLGLVLATALASRGMTTTGYDPDPARGATLLHGPLDLVDIAQERGLGAALSLARPKITVASSVADAVIGADMSFIVVPTPSRDDGSFCPDVAVEALRAVGAALGSGPPRGRPHLVVLVSTVSPGTTRDVLLPALRAATHGTEGQAFCLCYAPALVALGTVLDGFLSPDFAFVGETEPEGGARLAAVLARLLSNGTPIRRMSAESVEIAKIGLNNFLTMKISFSNLIGQLCQATPGANAVDVLGAIGADTRVGAKFLRAGMGYGGPCLPRDTWALAHALERVDMDAALPNAVASINTAHTDWLVRLAGPVAGRRICVYGLAYRAGSHVSTDSASIALANALDAAGGIVTALDPMVREMDLAKLVRGITATADTGAAIAKADILVLTMPMPQEDLARLTAANPRLRVLDVLDPHSLQQRGRVPLTAP